MILCKVRLNTREVRVMLTSHLSEILQSLIFPFLIMERFIKDFLSLSSFTSFIILFQRIVLLPTLSLRLGANLLTPLMGPLYPMSNPFVKLSTKKETSAISYFACFNRDSNFPTLRGVMTVSKSKFENQRGSGSELFWSFFLTPPPTKNNN